MKDLPYFKFIVSEWNDGDITLCSMEAQGLFINLCALYWSQQGDLRIAKSKRRYSGCNASAWKELISEGIIKVSGDNVFIKFLDKQFEERKVVSRKNSENASKRWENDASASDSHSESNAVGHIEEKKRKEENKGEEKIREIGEGDFFVSVKAKYLHEVPLRIFDLEIYFMETKQLEQIKKAGWGAKFLDFLKANPGAVYDDGSHLYNAFKKYATGSNGKLKESVAEQRAAETNRKLNQA